MGFDLGSVKEHTDVIAVLGAMFTLWSSNRMLNKFEKNDSDLATAIKELNDKVDAKHKEVITKADDNFKELNSRREDGLSKVYIAFGEAIKNANGHLEEVRVARDQQVGMINGRLATLEGEHKSMLCIVERRKHVIDGIYDHKRLQGQKVYNIDGDEA
jgi:hypothetical protein